MKALVKSHAREGLWLEEQPEPAYGINDVRIKVLRTSICGTDVHIWNWDAWAQKTIPVPMIVGHEFVGRIEALGSNVRDFAVGDLVSAEGHVVCGRCRNCLAGRRHCPACGRTLCGDYGCQRVPAGACPENGGNPCGEHHPGIPVGGDAAAGHEGRLRCGHGNVGNPTLSGHDRRDVPWRQNCVAGSAANGEGWTGTRSSSTGSPSRHLRTGNVRNMVQDDLHVAIRADVMPVITHRFPYTEFEEGFQVLRSGNSGNGVA